MTFALGLVSGIAVVSIIGFIIMLTKGGDMGNKVADTGGSDTQVENPSQPPQPGGGPPSIEQIAVDIGLDEDKFNSCLSEGRYTDKVNEQYQEAVAAGGQGTPFNIIVGPNGDAYTLAGAYPGTSFSEIIDPLLKGETPPAAAATVPVVPVGDGDYVRGSEDAQVTVIEYSDLQCPFCARHHGTMLQLMSQYEGEVNWVFRHFPLRSIHPQAQRWAEATECAGELGGGDAFWAMSDKIFEG